MAAVGSGKVHCPTCGATSTKTDFGREGFRRSDPTRMPLDTNPETVRRRNRAHLMQKKNASSRAM